MQKFWEGQRVKLIEEITVGSYTYHIGHAGMIICILEEGNKIEYLLDGDVFDLNTQEYNSPFFVTEDEIENNENFQDNENTFDW